ncbi:DUF4266 domain-containing protein [Mitsuaria sp. GD03876]|uniref:DUF4266 domain-containing protein n=1 Tax=Mitsuaria sp. GD03876 TaxID=2975399 RepID=UPI0024468E82|nr:DUF4266 domain-containing protein [Mitsuaria sp. GD03876]MDH0864004.1 DUF4266 domain-containing protein [Mitsuaria sp. GD03876]
MSLPPTPRRHLAIDRAIPFATTVLIAFAATGCAMRPPQPWEKGALARPEMTMGGDVLGDRFAQHIYTSKENASGGNGVGGGGCGCN